MTANPSAPAAMPGDRPGLKPLTTELDGREVLFFASYCGDDNPDCSARRPCPDCLGMSNVFRIKGTATYSRQLAPNWFAADVPISDDQMRRIEKRIRAKIRREDRAKRKAAAIRAQGE